MSTYGWQVFSNDGSLLYDHSVIMSRRLGIVKIPAVNSVYSATFNVNISGGTPFAHCQYDPSGKGTSAKYFSLIIPDIIFSSDNKTMTVKYTDRHFLWPADESGVVAVTVGSLIINYGVYNK